MMISPLRRLKARLMALDYGPCLVFRSGLGGTEGQINGKHGPRLDLPDRQIRVIGEKRGMRQGIRKRSVHAHVYEGCFTNGKSPDIPSLV